MALRLSITLWILPSLILFAVAELDSTNVSSSNSFGSEVSSKILSRRKRFLIFPDGSSFQLVFCTQTHGYLQIGDIVWFGNTAALAWELPTDPKLFNVFKSELRDPSQPLRRQDIASKHIYYLDDVGKLIAKVPYKRKPIVNPAFAKRSVPSSDEDRDINITKTLFIKKMHEMQKSVDYLQNVDETIAEFHREGRKGLYKKLETFLEALGWRGRDCILRMLCEVGKTRREQGTFLEEIFKATFTLPKGRDFSKNDKEYDIAYRCEEDCGKLYQDCVDIRGNKFEHIFK